MIQTKRIADTIRDIANHIFEVTCYMFPLEEWELDAECSMPDFNECIASIVQFDGAAEGAMVIQPTPSLLDAIAANMLGIETVDREQKEGALCEIANIICGNTVPLFAHNKQICYIRPPRIVVPNEKVDQLFKSMHKEVLTLFLDEGAVQITTFYSNGEHDD